LKISQLEIIDDPEMQDGMKIQWPIDKVKTLIQQYVDKHQIQGVITFDDYGVSGHINHRAVSEACR
jgi:N-acetylglucosaminylphosphatidylinositol deacetylase